MVQQWSMPKPDSGQKSQFLPTSLAHDAPISGGLYQNIAITFGM